MVFDEIISLGGNCVAAHQIRRHFGIKVSMPLDWCVVPFSSLLGLFADDFRDFINIEHLALWRGTRQSIQCGQRGIIYHHDFPRDEDQLVEIDKISEVFAGVKEKYERRIARLREACKAGKNVLFVRSWREILNEPLDYPQHCIRGVPSYDFRRLLNLIEHRFPGLCFQVLFVNYGCQEIDDSRAIFKNVHDPGDAFDWTGSPIGWDEVFNSSGISWARTPE